MTTTIIIIMTPGMTNSIHSRRLLLLLVEGCGVLTTSFGVDKFKFVYGWRVTDVVEDAAAVEDVVTDVCWRVVDVAEDVVDTDDDWLVDEDVACVDTVDAFETFACWVDVSGVDNAAPLMAVTVAPLTVLPAVFNAELPLTDQSVAGWVITVLTIPVLTASLLGNVLGT
jgi:hypothetical protein